MISLQENANFAFAPRGRGFLGHLRLKKCTVQVCPSREGISRILTPEEELIFCLPLVGGDASRSTVFLTLGSIFASRKRG